MSNNPRSGQHMPRQHDDIGPMPMTRAEAMAGVRVRALIGDTTRTGTILRCHRIWAQVWVKWESGRDSWIDLASLTLADADRRAK